MFVAVHWHEREKWIQEAQCRGMDIDLFFPDDHSGGTHSTLAVEACKACPVREQCAEWAIRHESHGYQGGMTPQKRHRERIKRRIALWSPQQNA